MRLVTTQAFVLLFIIISVYLYEHRLDELRLNICLKFFLLERKMSSWYVGGPFWKHWIPLQLIWNFIANVKMWFQTMCRIFSKTQEGFSLGGGTGGSTIMTLLHSIKSLSLPQKIQKTIGKTMAYCSWTIAYCQKSPASTWHLFQSKFQGIWCFVRLGAYVSCSSLTIEVVIPHVPTVSWIVSILQSDENGNNYAVVSR